MFTANFMVSDVGFAPPPHARDIEYGRTCQKKESSDASFVS
jgi:hypothetical protein